MNLNYLTLNIEGLTKDYAKKMDKRVYRILSGKFKLRKDGELDKRFKENKKIIAEENLK